MCEHVILPVILFDVLLGSPYMICVTGLASLAHRCESYSLKPMEWTFE